MTANDEEKTIDSERFKDSGSSDRSSDEFAGHDVDFPARRAKITRKNRVASLLEKDGLGLFALTAKFRRVHDSLHIPCNFQTIRIVSL